MNGRYAAPPAIACLTVISPSYNFFASGDQSSTSSLKVGNTISTLTGSSVGSPVCAERQSRNAATQITSTSTDAEMMMAHFPKRLDLSIFFIPRKESEELLCFFGATYDRGISLPSIRRYRSRAPPIRVTYWNVPYVLPRRRVRPGRYSRSLRPPGSHRHEKVRHSYNISDIFDIVRLHRAKFSAKL